MEVDMRSTRVLSLSLSADLLRAAERVAKQESRTRRDLFREALRRSIEGRRRAGAVTLFVPSPILDEVERVLIKTFDWPTRSAKDAIAAIRGFTTVVRPREVLRVIVHDEPDNRILECAVEAGAEAVITGDHDLRQLGTFRSIRIVG